jgi:hypothetical protein
MQISPSFDMCSTTDEQIPPNGMWIETNTTDVRVPPLAIGRHAQEGIPVMAHPPVILGRSGSLFLLLGLAVALLAATVEMRMMHVQSQEMMYVLRQMVDDKSKSDNKGRRMCVSLS